MLFTNAINRIKNLPKSFIAIVAIALIAMTTAGIAASADPVKLEGGTDVRNVTTGEVAFKDSTSLKVDEVAQVEVWLHNREAPDTEKASNTRVKIELPTEKGKTQLITGTSSSDNSNTVTDTAQVNLSIDRAALEFIPGSAKYKYNKGAADGVESCMTGYEFPADSCYATISVPDAVVNGGINLDQYRGGPLSGCNAYFESVTVKVRSVTELVSVNKYVRQLAEGNETPAKWSTAADAVPGDKLEYMIFFKNEGNKQLNGVVVGDNLPKYHKYVAGTTKLVNGNHPAPGLAISNDNITKGGINVGGYGVGSTGYVTFVAQLDGITAYERCGEYEVINVGVVRPEGLNEFFNSANVTIDVVCEEPEVVAICESLTASRMTVNVGEEINFTAVGTTTADDDNNDNDEIDNYTYTIDSTTAGASGGSSNDGTFSFTPTAAGTYTATATVNFTEYGSRTNDNCKVTITVEAEETPVYTCDDLTIAKLNDNTYRFTVTGSASNGATIIGYGYNYGDDSAVTVSTNNVAEHTYSEPGIYNASAAVVVSVNGGEQVATSSNCEGTVTIEEEEEETPVYRCDAVLVSLVGEDTYKFTVNTTATNGATVKDYSYDFGDDTEVVLTDNDTVEHTYSGEGTYNAQITVRFNVDGDVVTVRNSNDCAKVVTIDEEMEMCPIEGKENLPKDSPDCREQVKGVVKKSVLPSTGAGSIMSAFAAVTAAGTVGHSLVARRRK